MIRSPNDSRDYRLVERFHGEDLFSGPVTFDRFTFSAQSIRSRRGSTTIYQAPLERRRFLCDHRSSPFLFLCFPVYRGFFLSFFLSEEEIVQKNRGFISIHCSPFFLFLLLRVRTPLHALRRLTNATAWAISEVASCFFRDRIINITILFPFYAVNELRYVFCKYTQLFQTTTNN